MNGMKTDNIYRAARMLAAKRDKCLANRERAASAVYCSPEALTDYETGRTVPPCEVVQAMIETYGTPDLRGEHIRAACPLMETYGEAGCSQLERAALGWVTMLVNVRDMAQRFAEMAMDGRIDAEEREAAEQLRGKALEIMRLMQSTVDAIDKDKGGRKNEFKDDT